MLCLMCKGFQSIFRLVEKQDCIVRLRTESMSEVTVALTVAYLHEKFLNKKQVTV